MKAPLDPNAEHLVTESRTSGVAGAGRAAVDFRTRGLADGAVRTALEAAVPSLAATDETDVARARHRAFAAADAPPAGMPADVPTLPMDRDLAQEVHVLAQALDGAMAAEPAGFAALQLGIDRSLAQLIDAQVSRGQPLADAVGEHTGLLVGASPAEQVATTHRVVERLIAPPPGEQYPAITPERRAVLRAALAEHQAQPDADLGLIVHRCAAVLPGMMAAQPRPVPRVHDASGQPPLAPDLAPDPASGPAPGTRPTQID